jgi:hypothetical protein
MYKTSAKECSISVWVLQGPDIGGGFAEQPSPELLARWIQLEFFILSAEPIPQDINGEQEP